MGKAAHVRPRCFFDITINEVDAGRIIFELHDDIVPKTVANFRALCSGDAGIGKTTNKVLHYKGSIFHRVVRNFMIQAGDFSENTGRGGESIYGGYFDDENFKRKHDRPFLLSMANRGKNTNGSQFFITTQTASHLDGLHVVFGEVISGQEVVKKIERQPTDQKSKPYNPCMIANCGELVLMKKSKKIDADDLTSSSESDSSSDSSSSGSDLEEIRRFKKRQKKLKKKQKKAKKKAKKAAKEGLVDRGDGVLVNLAQKSDIPSDPPNHFLARVMSDDEDDEKKAKKKVDNSERDERRERRERKDDGGRKIKGRGANRIDRATTPPHWREGNSERISMRDYKEREQHRLAEERWSKSTRQPAKEELDPRVYGRYDEKQEDRKALEEKYREKQKEMKRNRRRREREEYYDHVKRERSDYRSRSRSPRRRSNNYSSRNESPVRESKFNRNRRGSESDMSD
ncbi:Oidioi.mRNA.OKI2018_I69.chr2.g8355.t1.cds [Oikopleura dioica]|uniref:peptidylprolyl isomerase n=1 Tax=Oikopleura dioica TaxID=34765 RepID=A0ABN7T8Z5_OIKDI|nr:Oidioi.mRNA.OKI2018_I69.chr2.g8355.t1.cds [Oikopleura dioica]